MSQVNKIHKDIYFEITIRFQYSQKKFIMTTLVLNLLDRVKQTKVVKESLDMLSIASETYLLYKNDIKLLKSENVPVRAAEDLYLQAVTKVTRQKSDEVQKRPDYKLVSYSAEKLRKARKISDKSMQSASAMFGDMKSKVADTTHNAKETFDVKLETIRQQCNCIMNRGKVMAGYAKTTANHFYSVSKEMTSKLLSHLLDLKLLDRVSGVIVNNSRAFLLNLNFYAHCLKNYTLGFLNDAHDSLNSKGWYQRVAKTASTEYQNLCSALSFILSTVRRNEGSITAFRKYLTSNASTSFEKNKRMIYLLVSENWKHFKSYFGNMNFELFYSPKDSVNIAEDSRVIYSLITGHVPQTPASTDEVHDFNFVLNTPSKKHKKHQKKNKAQ